VPGGLGFPLCSRFPPLGGCCRGAVRKSALVPMAGNARTVDDRGAGGGWGRPRVADHSCGCGTVSAAGNPECPGGTLRPSRRGLGQPGTGGAACRLLGPCGPGFGAVFRWTGGCRRPGWAGTLGIGRANGPGCCAWSATAQNAEIHRRDGGTRLWSMFFRRWHKAVYGTVAGWLDRGRVLTLLRTEGSHAGAWLMTGASRRGKITAGDRAGKLCRRAPGRGRRRTPIQGVADPMQCGHEALGSYFSRLQPGGTGGRLLGPMAYLVSEKGMGQQMPLKGRGPCPRRRGRRVAGPA